MEDVTLEREIEEPDSWFEKACKDFADAETPNKAMGIAWNHPMHKFYQHYTTLSSVVTKLHEKKWWLSRSDSKSLNDQQESQKFGESSQYKKTYQASFVHGASESAALWGLYVPFDPFAIRITIPGNAMEQWVHYLKREKIYGGLGAERQIKSADFKDIIYAAVASRDKKRDCKDIRRCNGLYWSEVNCRTAFKNLEDVIRDEECSGWFKDYEWRHERESRLCVRVPQSGGPQAMWVGVTDDLIKEMKFTFSPWLPKERETEVVKILKSVLQAHAVNAGTSRFRRSVLQNAMNLRSLQPT